MQYNPNAMQAQTKTEPGIYRWTVIEAKERTAKSGYDYMNLRLAVNVPDRKEPIKIYDKLLTHPNMMWKLKQFCEVAGLDFADGDLDAKACIGKEGDADFAYGEKNDKGRRYLEVVEYINPNKTPESVAAEAAPDNEPEDDIPF